MTSTISGSYEIWVESRSQHKSSRERRLRAREVVNDTRIADGTRNAEVRQKKNPRGYEEAPRKNDYPYQNAKPI